MKTLITGFGLCMMILISSSIQLNIISYGSREDELSNAINNAVIETQRVYLYTNKIQTDEAYMTFFNQSLKQYINSDSDIEVNFYGADATVGLLDVEVKESYVFNHETKTISCRRTNIIDEYETVEKLDVLKDGYLITYDIDSSLKLNLTGVLKGKTDPNANVLYHIKKGASQTLRILVNSGEVHSVTVDDKSLSFTVNQHYLVIPLENIEKNTTIKIR